MKNAFNVVLVMALVFSFVASANACLLGRALRGVGKVGKGATKVVNTVRPGVLFRK